MDEPELSRLALAFGVLATGTAGVWSLTGNDVFGVVTVGLLIAVARVQLVILSRPAEEEEDSNPKELRQA